MWMNSGGENHQNTPQILRISKVTILCQEVPGRIHRMRRRRILRKRGMRRFEDIWNSRLSGILDKSETFVLTEPKQVRSATITVYDHSTPYVRKRFQKQCWIQDIRTLSEVFIISRYPGFWHMQIGTYFLAVRYTQNHLRDASGRRITIKTWESIGQRFPRQPVNLRGIG